MPQGLRAGLFVMLLVVAAQGSSAQERVTLQADVLFYGDNTEFRNPFREGETIFGTAPRVCAVASFNDRVDLTLGAAGNHVFGGDAAWQLLRPVVSLTVRGRRSSFVFGTLPVSHPDPSAGPDQAGPHRLLPVLQRETVSFTRPVEAGLQWTFRGSRLKHDMWINWQRVNTAEHRERFDAGISAELRLAPAFALPIQLHVVHEGGQLFASGAVRDSAAGAIGVRMSGAAHAFGRGGLEIYGLASRFVPDRAAPERSRRGAGILGRAAVERAGWRAHVLFWRGRDVITEEGDPNYLSIRRDGSYYRGTRDYSEAGLTRAFTPAPAVTIAASARIHRTERHYEYSYRVLGTAHFHLTLR
jgi:hypothetical protein